MMTPAQSRAARGLLGWTQAELASAATVGVVTVRQFEGGNAEPRPATLTVMRQALEAAGVLFIAENGEGPGVRLKRTAFKHDASHLHALWDREPPKMPQVVGLKVEKTSDGLLCLLNGKEVGRITVRDGVVTMDPSWDRGSNPADRLMPMELQRWVEAAAGREA